MEKIQSFLCVMLMAGVVIRGSRDDDRRLENEFIFGIPTYKLFQTTYFPRVVITTTSTIPVTTTLTIPSIGYEVNKTITKHNHAEIRLKPDEIGLDVRIRPGAKKHNNIVIVRSSDRVSVHVIDTEYFEGDGFVVFPTSLLGKEYHVASYTPNHVNYPSFFCVFPIYSNTSVNIETPTGQKYQIILEANEGYRFDGVDREDLSGTFVQSEKPIAVISGANTYVPNDKCCSDGLMEQLPPEKSWGYEYTLAPFQSLNIGYVYRVYTTQLSSTLFFSNGSSIQIAADSFHEEDNAGNDIVSLTSDQPVMLVQYMKGYSANGNRGDPSMVVVPPITAFVNVVTFPVIEYGVEHTYYINVLTQCDFVNGTYLDLSPLVGEDSDIIRTPDESMCCLRSSVAAGEHTVFNTDSMARFYVTVYAIHSGTSSYAYPAIAFGLADISDRTSTTSYTSAGDMPDRTLTTSSPFTAGNNLIDVIIVIGVPVVGGVIALVVIVVIVMYCKRKKNQQTAGPSYYSTHLPPRRDDLQVPVNSIDTPYDISLNNQDNMGYDSLEPNRENPNYQGLYADISV